MKKLDIPIKQTRGGSDALFELYKAGKHCGFLAGKNGPNCRNTLLISLRPCNRALWRPAKGVFNQVADNGAGNLPGAAYNSAATSIRLCHSPQGSRRRPLPAVPDGIRPRHGETYGIAADFNRYIDNTDISKS